MISNRSTDLMAYWAQIHIGLKTEYWTTILLAPLLSYFVDIFEVVLKSRELVSSKNWHLDVDQTQTGVDYLVSIRYHHWSQVYVHYTDLTNLIFSFTFFIRTVTRKYPESPTFRKSSSQRYVSYSGRLVCFACSTSSIYYLCFACCFWRSHPSPTLCDPSNSTSAKAL